MFTATVRLKNSNDRLVIVTAELGGKWPTLAVETDGDGVEAVLGSHAHRFIGSFFDVSEAFAASEAYAAEWRAGKRADGCECDEIEGKDGDV